jgi:uncharacterized protein (TIGR00369 family)
LSASSERGPLSDLNRLIRENRVAEYRSPNLALGMVPVAFGSGTSQWRWEHQPAGALNPFGTIQGGYIAIFADEMLSTAIASVLEEDEWSLTIEFKVNFLRLLKPGIWDGSARVIRRTRSIAFLDAEIRDNAGAAAVTATSTWSIARR